MNHVFIYVARAGRYIDREGELRKPRPPRQFQTLIPAAAEAAAKQAAAEAEIAAKKHAAELAARRAEGQETER